MLRQIAKCGLLSLVVLGLAAPDVAAQLIVGPSITIFVPGLDANGNISGQISEGDEDGAARYFKFTGSGAIFGLASGNVTNNSGVRTTKQNVGTQVLDPEDGTTFHVATADIVRWSGATGPGNSSYRQISLFIP